MDHRQGVARDDQRDGVAAQGVDEGEVAAVNVVTILQCDASGIVSFVRLIPELRARSWSVSIVLIFHIARIFTTGTCKNVSSVVDLSGEAASGGRS